MLISYIYSPALLLEAVSLVITSYYNQLAGINITALYNLTTFSKTTYTTELYKIQRTEALMTHTQAQEYCLGSKMSMFEPTVELKLVHMMREWGVNEIWTPLFSHRTTGLLVNE